MESDITKIEGLERECSMVYEQRYKELLDKARDLWYNTSSVHDAEVLESLFPELKESDDEKVRKLILFVLDRCYTQGGYALHENEYEKMVAWLEKQGVENETGKAAVGLCNELVDTVAELTEEKKCGDKCFKEIVKGNPFVDKLVHDIAERLKEVYGETLPRELDQELPYIVSQVYQATEKQKLDRKFTHNPSDCNPYDMGMHEAEDYISKRGFDIPWNDCDVFVDERYITQTVANILKWSDDNPKENKHEEYTAAEWSEEDETILNNLIWSISNDKISPYDRDDYCQWLKSLRPQRQWKPSEEQIEAIEEALSLAKNCGEEYSFDLRKLLEQLKEL